jgi:hypothetical protein
MKIDGILREESASDLHVQSKTGTIEAPATSTMPEKNSVKQRTAMLQFPGSPLLF